MKKIPLWLVLFLLPVVIGLICLILFTVCVLAPFAVLGYISKLLIDLRRLKIENNFELQNQQEKIDRLTTRIAKLLIEKEDPKGA